MSTYPTTADVFANPDAASGNNLNTAGLEHDNQHANANDAIEAIEGFVGIFGAPADAATLVGRIKVLEAGGGGGGGLSPAIAILVGGGGVPSANGQPIPLVIALPDPTDPGFVTVPGGVLTVRDAGVYSFLVQATNNTTAGTPTGYVSVDLLLGLPAVPWSNVAGFPVGAQYAGNTSVVLPMTAGQAFPLTYTKDQSELGSAVVTVTKIG